MKLRGGIKGGGAKRREGVGVGGLEGADNKSCVAIYAKFPLFQ